MQLSNEWVASVMETDSGRVIERCRLYLDTARLSGKFGERVEMQWLLRGDSTGMPTDTEAEVIDQFMALACDALERSQTAVLTAIYTGAKLVRYMFYATQAQALTGCLQPLLNVSKSLPLRIGATEDPEWKEYIDIIARHATCREE